MSKARELIESKLSGKEIQNLDERSFEDLQLATPIFRSVNEHPLTPEAHGRNVGELLISLSDESKQPDMPDLLRKFANGLIKGLR